MVGEKAWDKATLNSEEIKPVAIAIIKSHTHTVHTLYTLARLMPVITVSYYTLDYTYIYDVKGINQDTR